MTTLRMPPRKFWLGVYHEARVSELASECRRYVRSGFAFGDTRSVVPGRAILSTFFARNPTIHLLLLVCRYQVP